VEGRGLNPFGLFERRVRGFRVVELGGLAVLLALILAVYLAKTGAGGKRADIERVQEQIVEEQTQIRMLRAEVATLERPERLAALATRYLGLEPVSARHEITAEALEDVAHSPAPDQKVIAGGSDPLIQPGSPDLPPAAPATGIR
jgi:cell division protein FtsL